MNIPRILNGLLIVAAGVILLLNNYGIVDWTVWLNMWRYWPVLLILLGLQLIVRKPLLNLGLVVILLAFASFSYWYFDIKESKVTTGDWKYSWELPAGLSYASLELDYGAGKLGIRESQGNLLESDLSYINKEPIVKYDLKDNTASFKIRQDQRSLGSKILQVQGNQEWNINLSPQVTWDLELDIGAIKADLDLSSLKVQNLDIDTGAGQVTISLGEHGLNTKVDIDAGASDLRLLVPETAGLRIKYDGVISASNLTEAGLVKEGNYYITPNLSSSPTQIEITIDAGASNLRLERIKAL